MTTKDDADHFDERHSTLLLQRQWPQLGKKLFLLEDTLTNGASAQKKSLTEQEKSHLKERIKEKILTQLYRDEEDYSLDLRYCALLVVGNGRGGEIVGNPYYRRRTAKNRNFLILD